MVWSWHWIRTGLAERLVAERLYTAKYKEDGSLERYKTRLVAKEDNQTYRVDYQLGC